MSTQSAWLMRSLQLNQHAASVPVQAMLPAVVDVQPVYSDNEEPQHVQSVVISDAEPLHVQLGLQKKIQLPKH